MGTRLIGFIKENRRILLLVLGIFIIIFYSRYSLLSVKVDRSGEESSLISLSKPEDGSQIKPLRTGLNLIRRGSYDITISSKKKKTVAHKKTSLIGFDTIRLELRPPKKADKITVNQDQSDCFFGDVTRVYFVCVKGRILKKTAGVISQGESIYANTFLVSDPVHYKDGVLVYTIDTSSSVSGDGPAARLSYISAQGVRVLDNNAEELQDEWGNNIVANGSEFIINNRSSQRLYFFKNENSKPIEYDYRSDVGRETFKNTVRTSLYNDTVFLSFSTPSSKNQERNEDLGKLNLLTYSTVGSIKLIEKLNLPESVNSAAQVTTVGDVAVAYDDISSRLDILNINKRDAKVLEEIINVENVAISDGSIFYSKQGDIYRYDSSSASSFVVATTNGTINHLLGLPGKLVFWLTPTNTPSQISSFVLNTKIDDTESIKPFDVLPYDLESLPVYSADYSGNTLVFNVKLDSLIYYRDVPTPSYNQDEYLAKQKDIKTRLKQDGLDINKLRILFEVGP